MMTPTQLLDHTAKELAGSGLLPPSCDLEAYRKVLAAIKAVPVAMPGLLADADFVHDLLVECPSPRSAAEILAAIDRLLAKQAQLQAGW